MMLFFKEELSTFQKQAVMKLIEKKDWDNMACTHPHPRQAGG